MNTLYDAQARMDDFRRRADQMRQANQALASKGRKNLLDEGQRLIGRSLIALGSRLDQPVHQPTKPALVCGRVADGAPLTVSECCA